MPDKITTLTRLAQSNPDAVSDSGWQALKAAGVDLVKGVSYPEGWAASMGESSWLRSPSGYLVSGPDARTVITATNAPATNSAIFAALATFTRHYTEPSLRLWRGPLGQIEESEGVDDHPIQRLLVNPSPWWEMGELHGFHITATNTEGNAYFIKGRAGDPDITTNTSGMVETLLPVPHGAMWPVRRDKSPQPVDYYALAVANSDKPWQIPIENVIHIRSSQLDPSGLMLGIGAVKLVAREVASDTEAARFVDAIMRNLGVVGLLISPKEQNRAGMDANMIREYIESRTTGDNRGRPMVFEQPTDLQQVATDMKALNLEPVWRHVETRISAVLGVPAILAGLDAGLQSAVYGAATKALAAHFTEGVIMSAWRRDGRRWTKALRNDFGLRPDEYLAFDWTGVRALQDDEDAKWVRVTAAWTANALTLGQLYKMLDLGEVDERFANARLADIAAGLVPGVDMSMLASEDGASLGVGQTQALIAMLPGVASGAIPYESAFATVSVAMGLGDEVARRILPAAPPPPPVVTVEEPRRLPAPKADTPDIKAEAVDAITDSEIDDAEESWRAWAKENGRADIAGWTWDADEAVYRDPKTGRSISPDMIEAVVAARADDARADLEKAAALLIGGSLTVAAWRRLTRDTVRGAAVELAMFGSGGREGMTATVRKAAGSNIAKQLGHLRDFAADVAAGKVPPGQVAVRAGHYARAGMINIFETGRKWGHKAAGYDQKWREGPADERACDTCKREIAAGKVDIDAEGFEIGGTECLFNDRCRISYSRSSDEG